MSVITVSKKGGVVIPAGIREKYHWKAGVRVKVVDYGEVVSLVPVLESAEDEGMGALKVRGHSLLRGLEQARKAERKRGRSRK
jgi:AbrB family looped-hinge helix DNA binding protein